MTTLTASSRLTQWIRAGEMLTLEGRRIFVRTDAGAGRPPLLLIHGYPTASYDWHLLWPGLVARYSVHALDLLGFGMSEKPADCNYLIGTQADVCQALLAHLGLARVHVLAHDYGTTVAQELLARQLEGRVQLDSVCFLNGGLFPETHRARLVQKLLALPLLGSRLAQAMTYRRFAATMRSIAGRNPPAEQDLMDLWILIERERGKAALGRLISYMAQRRRNRERWVGALVRSSVPRRLICGAVDPVSGAHLAARYGELVPDADVVLLDHVGHYPQLEDPQRVLSEYARFRSDR